MENRQVENYFGVINRTPLKYITIRHNMITIVIPILNRKEVLERTLESIANSDYRPVNLIMVDNGSTDGSMEIAQTFQRKYLSNDFDIYITEEEKHGASYARNKGLSRVKTKYVYFFDDDDLFSADFLSTFEKLLSEFAKETNMPDMVCLTTYMQVGNNKPFIRDYHFKGTNPVCNQIIAGALSTQSVIYRTDFLRSIGGWDENLFVWQDWALGVKALLHKPLVYWFTEKSFHTIFVHKNSITLNTNKVHRQHTIDFVRNQLTESKHLSALKIRQLDLKCHIPKLWMLAKLFK